MATSGSTDFSTNATTLIKDAMLEIGALAADETPTANEESHARRIMNGMIKTWQTSGHNVFRQKRGTITVSSAKGQEATPYTLGPSGDLTERPVRIESMRFKPASGNEIPMNKLNRGDYDDLPDKSLTGTPTNFYFDPQVGTANLHVWPIGSTGTLEFTYQRAIEDFDNGSDEPDFPQEWYEALRFALAARLHGVDFPQDVARRNELYGLAQNALALCLGFDREDAGLILERV